MRSSVFPTTSFRLAVALALVSLIALLAGCDGLHRAGTSSAVVHTHVTVHAAAKHVAAQKSIVPHSGRKALEEDDDDDDDGTDAATCVRSHRHVRSFTLLTRASEVPTRTLVDSGRPARPVEAHAPRRLVLATHDARGPPRA